MQLSKKQQKVFEKYWQTFNETWDQFSWNISSEILISEPDINRRIELEPKFFQMINEMVFIPEFTTEGIYGAINLSKFLDQGKINFEFLESIVRYSVDFLDYAIPDDGFRILNLGVIGWAELLAQMNIRYGSEESIKLAEYVSWFISFFSWLESIELAETKGAFPNYDSKTANLDSVNEILHSKFQPNKFNMEEIRKNGFRNASITTLSSFDNIANLAEVTSSVEPFPFISYSNPILQRKLESLNLSVVEIKELRKYLRKNVSLKYFPNFPDSFKDPFTCILDIPNDEYKSMVGAWRLYFDR